MRLKPVISARVLLSLIVLAGLSVAVAGLLPGDALARPVFQSPLPKQPPTATATLPVTGTRQTAPTVTATRPITVAPPTVPAAPATPQLPQPEPKVPGFLPPPTLSAPGGKLQPLLPGPGQPLVAPPAPTPGVRPTPTETTPAETLALARLIDTGFVALSYLWLCCGVLVLVAATLILVWLARRSRRT